MGDGAVGSDSPPFGPGGDGAPGGTLRDTAAGETPGCQSTPPPRTTEQANMKDARQRVESVLPIDGQVARDDVVAEALDHGDHGQRGDLRIDRGRRGPPAHTAPSPLPRTN